MKLPHKSSQIVEYESENGFRLSKLVFLLIGISGRSPPLLPAPAKMEEAPPKTDEEDEVDADEEDEGCQ